MLLAVLGLLPANLEGEELDFAQKEIPKPAEKRQAPKLDALGDALKGRHEATLPSADEWKALIERVTPDELQLDDSIGPIAPVVTRKREQHNDACHTFITQSCQSAMKYGVCRGFVFDASRRETTLGSHIIGVPPGTGTGKEAIVCYCSGDFHPPYRCVLLRNGEFRIYSNEDEFKAALLKTLKDNGISLEQNPDADDAGAIERTVAELASEEYSTREAATQKLAAWGRSAQRAIEQATRSPDAEQALRAKALLTRQPPEQQWTERIKQDLKLEDR